MMVILTIILLVIVFLIGTIGLDKRLTINNIGGKAESLNIENEMKIADLNFEEFINSFNKDYNLWMDIDSDIYSWINTKVLIASNSEFLKVKN